MAWWKSRETHVWIFSVGRGNAAFVRTGLNQGILVDMGATDEFDPAAFVEKQLAPRLDTYKQKRISQAVLSHPHSDHIAQCDRLRTGSPLYPSLLTCPHDKAAPTGRDERLDWKRIKNPSGAESRVEAYRKLYADRELPLQTIEYESPHSIPGLEYGVYYLPPPECSRLHESDDNEYGNATSIVVYVRHGAHSILFPGDMTPEGMRILLADRGAEKRFTVLDSQLAGRHPGWHRETSNQPALGQLLGSHGLSVLVAPHHGLESCFSPDLYSAIRGKRPGLVVISERRHSSPTDGTVDARYGSEAGASGMPVEIDGRREVRRSLSTVNGHHILLVFSGTGGVKVYAEKDPHALLTKI
jgi:hypothetical protein